MWVQQCGRFYIGCQGLEAEVDENNDVIFIDMYGGDASFKEV